MSTFKLDNLVWRAGEVSANSQYSVTADKVVWGTAKSWVSYNGVTTTIRGSFNISSVTKTATGSYDNNFATNLIDANYSATFGTKYLDDNNAGGTGVYAECGRLTNTVTTSKVRIIHSYYTGTLYEVVYSWVTVSR